MAAAARGTTRASLVIDARLELNPLMATSTAGAASHTAGRRGNSSLASSQVIGTAARANRTDPIRSP